jgi:hypothetical protein
MALGLAVGCSRPASVGIDIGGTARIDGTPLEMGMVVFAPIEGGESRLGAIQSDGSFRLYAIKPGRYRVGVQTSMFAEAAAEAAKAGRAAAANAGGPADGRKPLLSTREIKGTFRAVPKRFEDSLTSGIELDVGPGAALAIEVSSK